jgi:hypothetical protein
MQIENELLHRSKNADAAKLAAENAEFARGLAASLTRLDATLSALRLQQNVIFAREDEIKKLEESEAKNRQAVSEANLLLNSDLNARWVRESRGLERNTYAVALRDAREVLENALLIQNHDTRLEFLRNEKERWAADAQMVSFINLLMERL